MDSVEDDRVSSQCNLRFTISNYAERSTLLFLVSTSTMSLSAQLFYSENVRFTFMPYKTHFSVPSNSCYARTGVQPCFDVVLTVSTRNDSESNL